MPNPWILLGLIILCGALCAGAYEGGYQHGVDHQKALDQVTIATMNKAIETQKDQAAAKYKDLSDQVIAAMAERDKIKTQLEAKAHELETARNAIRDHDAGLGLRFAAKSAGPGCSGDRPQGTGASPAVDAPTAVVQLSDEAAAALRALAYDADQVADDYKICYAYTHPEKP